MEKLQFSYYSLGYSAAFLASGAMMLYFLFRHERTAQSRILIMVIGSYFVLSFGFLLRSSIYSPDFIPFVNAIIAVFSAFNGAFVIHFFYAYPENHHPVESRYVILCAYLTGTLVWCVYVVSTYDQPIEYNFKTQFYQFSDSKASRFLSANILISMIWVPILLIRKIKLEETLYRRSLGYEDSSFTFFDFFRLQGNRSRSLRSFTLAIVLQIYASLLYVLYTIGSITWSTFQAIIAFLTIAQLLLYTVVFVNSSAHKSTLKVKLVGITFATALVLVTMSSWFTFAYFENGFLQDQHRVVQELLKNRRGEVLVLSVDRPKYFLNLSAHGDWESFVYGGFNFAGGDTYAALVSEAPWKPAELRYPGMIRWLLERIASRSIRPADTFSFHCQEGYRVVSNDKNPIYYYAYRCETGDGPFEIGFLYDDYRKYVHSISALMIFILVIVALVVLTVFPLFFQGGLVQPLRNLTEGIHQVNAGNLDVHIRVRSQDEIGFLTGSFNQMVESISQSQKQLSDYAEKLEEKVRLRTKELLDSNTQIRNLNDLARAINDHPDPHVILKKVHAYIEQRLGVSTAWVLMVDAEIKTLETFTYQMSHERELSDEKKHFLAEFCLDLNMGEISSLARTYRRRRILIATRISDSWVKKYPLDGRFREILQIQSTAQIPLILEDSVVGILVITLGSNRIKRNDADWLSALGSQIAGAVQNARLLQRVQEERKRSDALLLNIIPARVAEELKQNQEVQPVYYESVTVLFTDFVGFTEISSKMTPNELLHELDGCFTYFDSIVKRYGLEKLKTIGDAYMCAGGLPTLNRTHVIDACLAALEFQGFMQQLQEIKNSISLESWRLRVGIHTGPVTAGVIGTHKFAYDIWGDTVNTASRMESGGEQDRINVSGEVYAAAHDFFDFEYRGKLNAKGKGMIDMYFLNGIRSELSEYSGRWVPSERFHELYRHLAIDSDT